MKSTHNKAEQQQPKEIKYPCLMVADSGDVVLFNKYECGTVVAITSKSLHTLGHYSNDWNMANFKTPLPSTESVTLQNN